MENDHCKYLNNFGERPYNTSGERILQEIAAAREMNASGEISLLLLKPGFFSNEKGERSVFQDNVEGLISACGLDVLATSCIKLSPDEIHDIYTYIYTDKEEPPPDFVIKMREELEEYMSDYVFSYLVFGENAQSKMETVRTALRESIGHAKGCLNVKNAVHLSEGDDVNKDIRILFMNNYNESE